MVVQELERTLSVSQAARLLGLSAARVVQLSNEGVLSCVRTPVGRLFVVEVVEKLAREREQKGVGCGEATRLPDGEQRPSPLQGRDA